MPFIFIFITVFVVNHIIIISSSSSSKKYKNTQY